MNKNLRFLYCMNWTLLIIGIVCLVTGYILDFHIFREIFVRSTMGIFKQVHKWSGYFFTAFLLWHLLNKWGWFSGMTKKLKEIKEE
ncbi:DUF4405 domain-containing protein [Anaerosinus sp.]|uniref:DUF4405 domain-containing protein n=1 Tax=Selenobaculum sp. TaxID=3074374 RepID=UPI003AB24A76